MTVIRKIYAVLLFLSLSISPANAKLFGAENFFLDNGLQVIVIPNHKAPIVKQMLWYKAGAVDEESGRGGTAHLLEHLMFRGTDKVKGSRLNDILEQNGAESNAFTSLDYTAYHQSLDISKLELAMALEADRMQNLKITPKDFELERDIVFQERKQVVENNPAAPFSESYRRLLWQEHPYGRTVSGTSEEIKSLKIEDVKKFYKDYYSPDNAVLILSGDIDTATAKVLAEKYYGKIKPRALASKKEFPKINENLRASLKMELPQINAERLVRTYIAPSYNTDKKEIYNLSVFSKYLGEGETSELYKSLVLDKKLALSVSSDYDFASRSYGRFSISALPAEGVSPEDLNKAIDEELAKAVNGLNIDKVNKTKDKMLAGLVYLQDNPFEAASIVGGMAAVGMTVDDIEKHADNIRKVSYQNVKKAANKLFSSSARIDGILSPKGEK